jgi:predicted membrane protein
MGKYKWGQENWKPYNENRNRDKKMMGIVIVLIGILLLLKVMNLIWFSVVFSWPSILICIGVLIGIKNRFRNNAWWILILIGVSFLNPDYTIHGVYIRHYLFPIMLILIGLSIVFRPRKRCFNGVNPTIGVKESYTNPENTLNIDVTFGGRKEYVTSKDFRGGTVNATFGGCELNLMQADTTADAIVLDLKVSFGGIELIVPSHWQIRNEINPAFSNVEDERMRTPMDTEKQIVLILRGSVSFGNVEIKSY